MNKYFGEWYFEDIIAHIDKFELGTKIRSERGDIYNLSQAEGEGKQRKFSRWNGTRLRFMTYENIGKKFEILEDNTEEIEELKYDVVDENGIGWYKLDTIADKVTELIKAVNEIRKDLKDE